jgi:hypothetical protein
MHIQLTILIDTQLNIHSEVSIIVVQAHSGRKGDICTYTYTHILMMKSEQKHLGGGGERTDTCNPQSNSATYNKTEVRKLSGF